MKTKAKMKARPPRLDLKMGEDGLYPHEHELLTASKLTLPTGYLSPSAVDMYLRCPAAYYRSYVEKDKRPPGISMAEGKAHHVALEHNNKSKKRTGRDVRPKTMTDRFVAALEKESKEVEDWEGQKKDDIVTRGRGLVEAYLHDFAPDFQPDMIEQEIRIDIGPVPVVGYLDADGYKTINGKEETVVVDYKVVGKKKSQAELVSSIQLATYGTAEEDMSGERYPQVGFVNLIKPSQTVAPQFFRFQKHQRLWLRSVVLSVANAISLGSFPLAPPTSWACSERFCGYWWQCRGRL